MDEQANAPAGRPMAVDSAAVVSETDAAHSSADEEGWLRHTHVQRHQRRLRANNSATNNTETSNDEDSDDDESTTKEAAGPGDLYCENMDDEDEAWVYKHMRSGKEELVHVRRQQQQKGDGEEGASSDQKDARESSASTEKSRSREVGKHLNNRESTDEAPAQNEQLQQALLLKPRSSDAILSCPRCFNIVCMDCQQHERYANQYRAMFVMNIGVNWTKRMRWDDAAGGLKLDSATDGAGSGGDQDAAMHLDDDSEAAVVPQDALDQGAHNNDGEKEELFHSVHCGYCQWELAALDMKDEIYYFYGCIASA